MSNRLDRVVETLISLGIPRDSLPTSRLEVSPSHIPVDGQRVRAYPAKSMVRLRIWDLDRVDEVLSSALAAGATHVEYLE